MPDEIMTDEQKQVIALLSRWNTYDEIWSLAYGIGLGTVLVGVSLLPVNILLVDGAILIGGIAGRVFFSRWMAQRFVRRLSKEERAGIQNALKPLARSPKLSQSFLLRFHPYRNLQKACNGDVQTELLRASQQIQDDTLLRAATFTETTPQDQLLRPANSDNL